MREMREARSDPKAGEQRRLEMPCAKVFKHALAAASALHLDVIEEDRANGELLLRRGSKANVGVTGDRVAVWLDRAGAHACEVRVFARNAAGVFGAQTDADWPPYFFRQMKRAADDASE